MLPKYDSLNSLRLPICYLNMIATKAKYDSLNSLRIAK